MKKIIISLLCVLLLVVTVSSCGGSKAGLFKTYENVDEINGFHNGLAAFVIHLNDGSNHWGTGGAWTGTYLYGYVDTKGKVVIDPIYEYSPGYHEVPDFEYNYVKVWDKAEKEYIIDKKGEVIFEVGGESDSREITAIGEISQGYFWVETVYEALAGNQYTVKYYSAEDLSVVATFEDIRAIPDNRTIGGKQSTLDEDGMGLLAYDLDQYSWSDDDIVEVDISEYDTRFSSVTLEDPVDVESIPEFKDVKVYSHFPKGTNQNGGQVAAVALYNSDGVWFYATIDDDGDILMEPQKNIAFPLEKAADIEKFEFCNDLCPAMDAETGFWGYIDARGNWLIKPQYTSAKSFTEEGLAVVNDKIVIDVKGRVVISPAGWKNEIVTELNGKYKYQSSSNSGSDFYLTFTAGGEVKYTESYGSLGSTWVDGTYEIKGAKLIIDEVGSRFGWPIKGDGEHTIRKEGDKLIIDDTVWEKVS